MLVMVGSDCAAAMVAAAVRAAVTAKAPRRTVSAVAAAVASALARPASVAAKPRADAQHEPAETQLPSDAAFDGASAEALLEALRSRRREQRTRKKERRRARREAATAPGQAPGEAEASPATPTFAQGRGAAGAASASDGERLQPAQPSGGGMGAEQLVPGTTTQGLPLQPETEQEMSTLSPDNLRRHDTGNAAQRTAHSGCTRSSWETGSSIRSGRTDRGKGGRTSKPQR